MAIMGRGPLGGFSGKLGNVVGCNRNGKFYLKSSPRKSNQPPSPKQLEQRERMKLAAQFVGALKEVIMVGYQYVKPNHHPVNKATSYHSKEAIAGTWPELSIDYPKVKLSHGYLSPPSQCEVKATGAYTISLTWPVLTNAFQCGDDELLVVVLGDTIDWPYWKFDVAKRDDGSGILTLDESDVGKAVHVYAAYVSANGKKVSNSWYLGQHEII
ncbi:DUF6266 family protein [Pedobacter sp. BMA]|uniref:DUF6266 family protein n=1 Tax=Pedobacter sp. BMA TaxID=1663685 RepID=UPI00064A4138|nr:DUF6266 family protein [Pedobacter sp. BMA]KLT64723.1 hypothetical protein AB669_13310 [Pedobacter sp. BMA]